VLSTDEVARFLAGVPNLKHRMALTTAYAAGLRVSEVVRLKIAVASARRSRSATAECASSAATTFSRKRITGTYPLR
jgi:site-specific recombinase XerD